MSGVKHPAVVGAGMVGCAMATLFAGNGYATRLLATSEAFAQKALETIDTYLADLQAHDLVNGAQAAALRRRITPVLSYDALQEADFVFEAVPEKTEIKAAVYAEIEAAVGQECIIASATSAIPAAVLGPLCKRPGRFLVAHPWNPAHLVPLVEISRGPDTTDATVEATVDFLETGCGRAAVVLQKELPGFIGNRLQHAMLREAMYMVEEGVCTAEDINKAVRYGFGQRYSTIDLFEHYDCAGLPLQAEVQATIFPTLCNAAGPQRLLAECIERGDLGMQTGRGVLDWSTRPADDFRGRQAAPFYRFFNWKLPLD